MSDELNPDRLADCDGWDWAGNTLRRETGLIEHTCPHGVGHPNVGSALWMNEAEHMRDAEDADNPDDLDPDDYEGWGVHGCDGCCAHESFPGYRESLEHAHRLIRAQNERIVELRDELAEATVRAIRADVQAKVRQFHTAFGQPVRDTPTTEVDDGLRDLRVELIREEFEEYARAVYGPKCRVSVSYPVDSDHAPDIIEIADAMGDIAYVLYGAALVYGIDLAPVVSDIHYSNMSKLDPETGEALYRADGKVKKGSDYFPPNLAFVLAQQGWVSQDDGGDE